ncbi:MAG: phosphatidic acid phosphatase type 2/haloperoxidase [Monoraphidium minutum]|nr:MAG: phosphatidic acid phosphatase type 2/haloperoxidase [Monoraphidium minutum]
MLGAQAGGGGGGGGGGAARGAPRAVRAAQALLQRERLLDWGLVVAGAIVLIATDVAAPTQPPYILKDSLPDLSHPLRPNSVPAWSVPLLGVLLPLAAVAAYALAFRRPTEELHKLALGVLGSVAIAGSITNVLKVSVRRPRPDFAPRCWPDGKPAWRGETEWGGYPVCSGDAGEVWEGLKSFPSGHSSWSASGLGYLSWLLLDRLQPLDGGGHVGRLAAALLPALGACAVGVTRCERARASAAAAEVDGPN